MDAKLKTDIESLIEKASNAPDAVQAINFSQAACNAANALRVLGSVAVSRHKAYTGTSQ